MRLAFFSPLPPAPTGIADYSATLLPHLAQLADVTAFVSDPAGVAPRPVPVLRDTIFDADPEAFDLCLYQMGNNTRYHNQIYDRALARPGLTVLHDLTIYAFQDDRTLESGRRGAYFREMGYAYGLAGVAVGLHIVRDPAHRDDQRFPLLERLGDASLGMLVHSRYARDYVRRHCPRGLVRHVNQPIPVPTRDWRQVEARGAAAKTRLGYPSDVVLAASFGYAAPTKRIHHVLPVLAALAGRLPRLRYVIVGSVIDNYPIREQVHALGLDEVVRFTDFVDATTYDDYLAAADIGINLRFPTTGETSAALLRLLAAGTPTLVSDVDAFAELPDAACAKITPAAQEAELLATWITRLAEDTSLRAEMGRHAVDYIADACAPSRVAGQYMALAREILENAAAIITHDSVALNRSTPPHTRRGEQ